MPDPRVAAPVPAAKIHPPGLAADSVLREVIAGQIAAATGARLVLVRAPAGFGKTTALQQIRRQLEAAGCTTAWLTLDAGDNDLPRCLACLAAALQPLGLDGGGDLVEQWAGVEQPFGLFLDDVEHLQASAVTSLVGELIERLPRSGRVFIGSRSLPALPLGRLRARGQLLEIDAAQLRFSTVEAGRFFAARGIPLAAPALDRLHTRTEGWITALWLVAMALERHPVASDFVAGLPDRVIADHLADFLAEDVLAHQPPDVRDFLLRTSILRTLEPKVCAALVPRVDAAAMLQRLEAANLFIAPVGGAPSSHRYHSLFGQFLRDRLAAERPDEVARLHLAASGWFEAAGRPVPAIDHALEGGDPPHALHLLAGHAEAFLEQGRMRLLDRWFSALPAASLAGAARLQVIALWAACFTRGAEQAMAELDRSGCADSADPVVRAHVAALRPMLLAMRDRLEEAGEAGRAALDGAPSGIAFPDSVLANVMAHIVAVLGDRPEAHRLLDAARRRQRGSRFNRMVTESIEGSLDLAEGRLREASARFRIAVGATSRDTAWSPVHGNAWAGVLYTASVYESGDLGAANRLLDVYLPLARDVGLADHMIVSHRMRARIAFAEGDVDAAFRTLAELEYLGHDRRLARVSACAKLERARLLLLQGHGGAARDELDRADDPALWQRVGRWRLFACELDDLAIGRWRWAVHAGDARGLAGDIRAAGTVAGDPRRAGTVAGDIQAVGTAAGDIQAVDTTAGDIQAVGTAAGDIQAVGTAAGDIQAARTVAGALQAAAADAERAGRRLRGLKLRTLQAIAQVRFGRPEAALDTLLGVLRATAAEGFVRLLVDEGPALVPLLRRVSAADAEGPIVADHVQHLLRALGADAVAEDVESAAPPAALTEPLTRKELRALQLLAEGYSNSAMAEKLFVSDSTVRTHLRSINLKLGAKSRTQALALARRHRLIR